MSWLNFLYKVKSSKQPNPDSNISARLFVNYWKLPYKSKYSFKKYSRWLDVGVILDGISENIEEVAICLPFKVKKEDIEDLSRYVKDDNLVSHILKEKYVRHALPKTPAYHRLEVQDRVQDNAKDNEPLYLYEICDESKSVKDLHEGSAFFLKILSDPIDPTKIKESPDDKSSEPRKYSLYFHFRVNNLSETDLSHNENISNDLVQSAFSKSEMVDILFNDLTNLDHSDHQILMNEYQLLTLSNVDFAFIGSSEDETVIGNKPFDDCELLEPKIWGDYTKGINPDGKKCIAYHWILPNKPWKVFFKTVYSSRQGWKIVKYSFYVFLLSFLASLFLDCCKWVCAKFKDKDPSSTETPAPSPATDTTSTNIPVLKSPTSE